MILELMRYGFGLDSTIGRLYVDRSWFGFTLEDERRKVKVPGKTCIWPGTYELGIRHGSPKFAHLDDRWDWHHGMIHVLEVPDFSWIYLHPGVTDQDTRGCILPGLSAIMTPRGEFEVRDSRDAYERLYKRVRPAIEDGAQLVVMDDLSRDAA